MRFVIVSGMSGAGKSSALKMLEDAGYFCVDNLPLALLKPLVKMTHSDETEVNQVAIGVDMRSGDSFEDFGEYMAEMKEAGYTLEVLYLDASDDVLVRRYKETRRRHPLAGSDRIESGINLERHKTAFIKSQADYVIDTSTMLTRELKAQLDKIFVAEEQYDNIFITVLSFGFKYGIPADSDLVFDVRFLPNPYYVPELKYKTGNDKEIQEFVMSSPESSEFLDKLFEMLEFLIPQYKVEGKYQLVVSIGCTGGKHRSVTLANALFDALKEHGYSVKKEHRDIEKDAKRQDKPRLDKEEK